MVRHTIGRHQNDEYDVIPIAVQRATATVIFALGIFMIAAHTLMAGLAAPRLSLDTRRRAVAPFLVGAYLATWLAVGVVVADGSNFPSIDSDALLPIALLVGFGPMFVAMALLSERSYWARSTRRCHQAG